MKKLTAWLLALMLMLGMVTFASAEETKVYRLGDKMEDFTATLVDGTEVSLYGLLAEKKAVLINFWATWCTPCRSEFPFMQEAYDEVSGDIAILALSTEPSDTNDAIIAHEGRAGFDYAPYGQRCWRFPTFCLSGNSHVSAGRPQRHCLLSGERSHHE